MLHADFATDLWQEAMGTTFSGSNYTQYSSRITSGTNNQCIVLFSFFGNISSSAIYFSSNPFYLLHSDCMFDTCRSNGNGGGVDIISSDGVFYERHFCAINCDSSGDGMFSNSDCKNSTHIEGSGINCITTNNGYGIITIRYDNTKINSVNVSDNIAYYSSVLMTENVARNIKINLSSFANNYETNGFGCTLVRGPSYFDLCNWINNSQQTSDDGILYVYDGTCSVTRSSFWKNCQNGIGSLIRNDGTLSIENCYISSLSYYGNYPQIVNNRTLFVNELSLYSTMNCHAEIPIIDNENSEQKIDSDDLNYKDYQQIAFHIFMAYAQDE